MHISGMPAEPPGPLDPYPLQGSAAATPDTIVVFSRNGAFQGTFFLSGERR